ncbi:glycosyltransferase family 61 protein [Halovulum sp. GXIMD14793]
MVGKSPRPRLLQGQGPQGVIGVETLRAARQRRFVSPTQLTSDNPIYEFFRQPEVNLTAPPLRRVMLQDVQLQLPQHLIRLGDQVYYDLSIGNYAQWREEPTRRISGHSCIGTNSTFHNFFHWMAECLPGLLLHEGDSDQVLMPAFRSAWQESTLALGGMSALATRTHMRGVYEMESCSFMSTSTFAVSGHAPTGLWGEEVVALLGRIAAHGEVDAQTPRRLFISRADAVKRPFLDEDQVFEFLRPLGFTKVVLADLDPLQQVTLFRNADAVVAAHGAALVQMAYCRPGTQVFEIQHPSCRSSLFLRMALQFGHRYALYQEFDPSIPEDARLQPWHVDNFSALRDCLCAFLR